MRTAVSTPVDRVARGLGVFGHDGRGTGIDAVTDSKDGVVM